MAQSQIFNQIEAYATEMQLRWLDLLAMQIENYEEDGNLWKDVVAEYVFPKFPFQVPHLADIHTKLTKLIPEIFEKAVEALQFTFDVNFVLYVGLEVGAGWATIFRAKRAVLHGLENIVDCGWFSEHALGALTAHEIGHLVHQEWRDQQQLPNKATNDLPYWDLYEEGFAMRAEHKIMGTESFHEAEGQENWLEWCRKNRNWLAKEYLDSVGDKDKIRRFFGSWFNIQGQKQTGYFLGHEILKEWETEMEQNLKEIACMPMETIDERIKETLMMLSSIENEN
ncbi:MAG: hypothetical protein ACTSYI_11280 [Promethearchaeota archaeon]